MPDYSVLNSLPGINRVKGVKQLGHRAGNWLSLDQSSEVLNCARGISLRARRNYAMLALLFGCGLRRSELISLEVGDIQMRQGHWAIVDLIGKGGRIRTVPVPHWAKAALDAWMSAAAIREGRIFGGVGGEGKVGGSGFSKMVVCYVVKECCEQEEIDHVAPQDLRRTCANLCYSGGGELSKSSFCWAM